MVNVFRNKEFLLLIQNTVQYILTDFRGQNIGAFFDILSMTYKAKKNKKAIVSENAGDKKKLRLGGREFIFFLINLIERFK